VCPLGSFLGGMHPGTSPPRSFSPDTPSSRATTPTSCGSPGLNGHGRFVDFAESALEPIGGLPPSSPYFSMAALQPELLIRTRNGSGATLPTGARQHVYRIVLTGGPCAGKSSAAAVLQEQLTSHGFLVFTLPEVASLMFNAGANWLQFAETEDGLEVYQSALARIQIAHEDSFARLCDGTGKPCVVICDRGLLDGKAYCTPEVWEGVLEKTGLSETQMLSRYDAVAFLVTAADGAEKFYTQENNSARRESPEEAVAVDRRLRTCWEGHSHLGVFDNGYGSFPEKIDAVVQFVLHRVAASHEPRRFFLTHPSMEACQRAFPPDVPVVEQTIEALTSGLRVLKTVSSRSQVRHYVQEQQGVGDVVIERISKVLPEVFAGFRQLAEQEGAKRLVTKALRFTYRGVLWEVYYSLSARSYVLKTYAEPTRDLGSVLPPFLEVRSEVKDVDVGPMSNRII